MQLQINEKNEIIAWVRVGGIDGADLVEFDEAKLPDDFFKNFKSTLYLLKDGEVIENPDYVAPSGTPPVNSTNSVQEAINKLGEATAKIADDDNQIKSALNKLGLAVADLQQTKEVK